MKRCALFGCAVDSEGCTLKDIAINNSYGYLGNVPSSYVAKLLMKKHGYKETDILCQDCFWK